MIHFLYNWYLIQKDIDGNSFKKFIFWKSYEILKIALPLYYKILIIRKLDRNVENNLVVSLTSFPARIDTVHLTLKSIFNQSYKPRVVVLYLAEQQFVQKENDLPKQLLKLKNKGLIIKFCEDIKSHKKYFYSFKDYHDSKVVLIDDDVIYPINMLKTLVDNSLKFDNCIIANRIREINYEDNQLKPYRLWEINKTINNPSNFLFATGVGGVLYNPAFFNEALYSLDVIKKLCLNADDVWLKANALINDKQVYFTNKFFNSYIELPGSQSESLFSYNVFSSANDTQIKKVFAYFKIEQKNFF